MQKWEYQVTKLRSQNKEHLRERLNRFGSEGWELVSVYDSDRTGVGNRQMIGYLKRPIEERSSNS